MLFYTLGILAIAVIIMLAIYKARGLAQPLKWILIGVVAVLMFVPALLGVLAIML